MPLIAVAMTGAYCEPSLGSFDYLIGTIPFRQILVYLRTQNAATRRIRLLKVTTIVSPDAVVSVLELSGKPRDGVRKGSICFFSVSSNCMAFQRSLFLYVFFLCIGVS